MVERKLTKLRRQEYRADESLLADHDLMGDSLLLDWIKCVNVGSFLGRVRSS